MKPVLLEANRSCGSAWVPVDGARRAVVSGLTGRSYIRVEFGSVKEPLIVEEDGEYQLPEEVSVLKAAVVVLEDDTVVNMDLVDG